MKNKQPNLISFILMAGWLLVWPNFSGPARIDNLWQPKSKAEVIMPEGQRPTAEKQPIMSRTEPKENLPEKILLGVPFLSQAPFANWDGLHEEACEEAILVMLKFFTDGKKAIARDIGEQNILDIVAYESEGGYGEDITVQSLATIAEDFYGLGKPRIEITTREKIEREISNGRPVIIPAAGKLLENPNFKNGGPVYHMLLIRGYDENGFVTNDPGTRKGEGFRYSFENILEANHDWNKKNILDGEAVYLVFD